MSLCLAWHDEEARVWLDRKSFIPFCTLVGRTGQRVQTMWQSSIASCPFGRVQFLCVSPVRDERSHRSAELC